MIELVGDRCSNNNDFRTWHVKMSLYYDWNEYDISLTYHLLHEYEWFWSQNMKLTLHSIISRISLKYLPAINLPKLFEILANRQLMGTWWPLKNLLICCVVHIVSLDKLVNLFILFRKKLYQGYICCFHAIITQFQCPFRGIIHTRMLLRSQILKEILFKTRLKCK